MFTERSGYAAWQESAARWLLLPGSLQTQVVNCHRRSLKEKNMVTKKLKMRPLSVWPTGGNKRWRHRAHSLSEIVMHRLGSSKELVGGDHEVHGTIPVIGIDIGGAGSITRSEKFAAAELPLAIPCGLTVHG